MGRTSLLPDLNGRRERDQVTRLDIRRPRGTQLPSPVSLLDLGELGADSASCERTRRELDGVTDERRHGRCVRKRCVGVTM